MADPDKIPETPDDTQATYDPTAEAAPADTQRTENATLSESQDFQLIDEEIDRSTQNESEIDRSKDEERDAGTLPSTTADEIEPSKSQPELRSSEQKLEVCSDKDVTSTEADENKDRAAPMDDDKVIVNDNDDEDEDDDDFVQSSQQITVSPLKKQISNLISGISQKRKAEPSESPTVKFPRTCSENDALSSVRNKFDDDNDLFEDETLRDVAMDDVLNPNVVIQETPDSCVDEIEPESLQQVEKELEEALSQHSDEDNEIKKISANENTEKTDKSLPTKIDVEKVSSSTTIEEKKFIDDVESSMMKINDEKKLCPEKTTETKKSIEDEKSSMAKSFENEKSSTKKSDEDEKSLEIGENFCQTNNIDDEKSGVDVSTKNSENSETIVYPQKSPTHVELIQNDSKIVTKEKEPDFEEIPSEISKIPKILDKMEIDETPSIPIIPNKSRMSIEVIYDKSTAPPEKKRPRELVEIDEDGEKIVLDSSQENCDKSIDKSNNDNKNETYKTCETKTPNTDYKSLDSGKEILESKSNYSLTNGSTETKKSDSDKTTSLTSDQSFDSITKKSDVTSSPTKKPRLIPEIVISISDSENDSFVIDERVKNKSDVSNRENSSQIKIIEKELSIIVKLKCSIHIDETTKEQVAKIINAVHSEAFTGIQDLSSTRRRNSDVSACMADISGNANERDASPGSVTSNVQPYPLNARLSLASTTSSSSSGSSAASMNAKLIANAQFQLPRGPAKHAKKIFTEGVSTNDGKIDANDNPEVNYREWKNVGTLLTSFFNCVKDEITVSEMHNGSSERVDLLERITSSTPESEQTERIVAAEVSTPKHVSKRNRSGRNKNVVKTAGSNGLTKNSPVVEKMEMEIVAGSSGLNRKRKSTPEPTSRQSTNSKDSMNDTNDELIGKEVFAKWSDNKYYPGTVIGKTKTKYKVNFYDGQNKLIIEDFIVPMPTILHVGLSVYATSIDDDYGSCGIIIDAKKIKDDVVYTVQTDDEDELRVQIKNIFLTNDQVQVLREETKVELKTPPSTPKHLGKVSLDNVVEGSRRSKRTTTPIISTPKSKRGRGSMADKMANASKPSASGISSFKTKNENDNNYETTSDSNYSMTDEIDLLGVQPELIGTPNEQTTKGPPSRIKGKARSKKRTEDPDVVAKLGPIPTSNSTIFRGMSFILTCASLEIIDRFQSDTKDSNSDPGTENEEEWTRKPFVRERLIAQLTAGGGKLYEDFDQIPPGDYENTKLITNVPNLTKKSLLCLSVGIKAYNHQWIIRCCKENKIVNPSEEELPAGWSLMKQSYVEMFQRRNAKPFQTLPVIVVIPLIPGEKDFVTFWTHICQNAGGAVLLPESPDDLFIEGTVVLTNKRCPSWVIEKAKNWSIPLVSTTWVIQSLIEGGICTYDAHPSFDYNYAKRPSSHISSLKRLQ